MLVVTTFCVGLAKWMLGGVQVVHEKAEESQAPKEEKVTQSNKKKSNEGAGLKEKEVYSPANNESSGKPAKKKRKDESTKEPAFEPPTSSDSDDTFLGHLKTPGVQSIDFKLSRILVSSPNKELTLFDMKHYTKDNPGNSKKGYVMLESQGTAVAIGDQHYFVALEYDRTICYYQFVGSDGVYFKLVNKFKNKFLHKEPIMAMHVDDKETFIVTVGAMADTFIRVWSLKGEMLFELNTSQVEHHKASFGEGNILLRSWTPEVKLFNITMSKDGKEFSKIERGTEMSHSDGVLEGACDLKGENGVSLRKDRTIQLWKLDPRNHSSKVKKLMDHDIFGHGELSVCAIHTVENEAGRTVSIVALSDGNDIVLCDGDTLDIVKVFKSPYGGKDTVQEIRFTGRKSVVMYCYSHKVGRVLLWNISALLSQLTGHK